MAADNKLTEQAKQPAPATPAQVQENVSGQVDRSVSSLDTPKECVDVAPKAAPQPPGVDTDKASLLSQTLSKPQPAKTIDEALKEPAKSAQPVKPYVFDDAAFKSKVKQVETSVNEVSGKPNYNPHLFLAQNGFDDMIRQYKQGVRSQELFERMKQFPTTIPVVDENYVPPVPYKAELPKALQPPTRGK